MKRLRFLMFFITIIISVQIFAINSFASATTTFDHKEATALIGFIFDINPDEIREIDWDENSIYKLLTGQYQNGSREEAVAKIAFLSVAYENINQNIGEQNNKLNASRAHLLDYLEKHASEDIAGDMANGIIKDVLKSVSKCVMYEICGWDMDIIETFELSYDTIKDIKSLPNKAKSYAEKVQTAVVAGMEAASSSKRNMYMYFREYVNANVSMGEYADLYMEAYDLQLSQTIIAYDPILNWHSENNIQTLKRWAKYVSDMEISLSGQSGSDTNFVAKFVLNYPFAQDIICYTAQEFIDFAQTGMYKQSREGYTFDNWYYDAAGTIEYDGNFYQGMVLYAKWNKKPPTRFLITFNSNCSEVDSFSYIYDTTVGNWIDYKMSRPGYVFEGWYWDAACTQKASGENITINRDLSFYAKWVSQFKYTISNGATTITGINGYQTYDGETITDIEIPAYIDGYPVVAIGDESFKSSKISSVVIPNSITSIGDSAFSFCSGLTRITIPDSVTSIGQRAFECCYGLTSISFGSGVKSIGDYAFNYCNKLSSLTIPSSISIIGNSVFYSCSSLTSVTIPEGVTIIGDYAFSKCSSLTSIKGCKGVTAIGDYAFSACGSLTSITIPDSVTSIGKSAFEGCGLTAISFGIGVESIGDRAFYACGKLTNVYIGNSVKTIGSRAFYSCIRLTSVTIGESITSIGDGAFAFCYNLTTINVSQNNQHYISIDNVLFDKSKTMLIQYPTGKISTSYSIPHSVTTIGYNAFYYCKNLTTLTIPDSVTDIGDHAFSSCDSLTNVTIGNGVTTIGRYAFASCHGLTSITIPDSVTTISRDAFQACSGLTNVSFGSGIKTIGDRAFYGCTSLISITLNEGIANIGTDAFARCDNLTSVTLPSSISEIGDGIFSYCMNLTNITIPDNITRIGDNAFCGCNLTSITIPDSVTSIGSGAFYGCGLTSINIPDGITSISGYTFSYCTSLTDITIPDSVTSIGICAFDYCIGLTSITIPDSVTSIGELAFANCKNLTNITIPDGVTNIEYATFKYCDGLTSITISEGITTIGEQAFYKCNSLKTTYYRGTKEQWKNISMETDNDPLAKNVVFVKFTKTDISEDGKTFVVYPVNVEEGNTVIIALYNGYSFVEMQKATYKSEELEFITTKEYDSVKIMVWKDLDTLEPITKPEIF